MVLKDLSQIKKYELEEIVMGTLPKEIFMTDYSLEKSYKVNELVKDIYNQSYEWYGFTIAKKENPELIVDIGIGKNSENQLAYTKIGPEEISKFSDALPEGQVINGWIHSHGDLGFRQFSHTDDVNHVAVLNYVVSLLKKPIAKKEIAIKDISYLVENQYNGKELNDGSITLITDNPIKTARIIETIYGGFSYGVVIGDEGWHEQEIYYKRQSLLSGTESITKLATKIVTENTGIKMDEKNIADLKADIREKVTPPSPLGLYQTAKNYFSRGDTYWEMDNNGRIHRPFNKIKTKNKSKRNKKFKPKKNLGK